MESRENDNLILKAPGSLSAAGTPGGCFIENKTNNKTTEDNSFCQSSRILICTIQKNQNINVKR
jgi:hypothetical protein